MTLSALSRAAGATYVTLICLGLSAEFALRGPLIDVTSAAATHAAIAAHLPQFRMAILADAGMVLADVVLAVLLFGLLRPVHAGLALAAMVLRLVQASVIAASALALVAVDTSIATGAAPETVLRLVLLHAAGYDFGLIFFAGSTALTAVLLGRSGYAPGWLPHLLLGAALVYLVGSVTRIVAPDVNALIQPAYLIPVIAEVTLALALLIGPRRVAQTA